jgi:hypothetical protein
MYRIFRHTALIAAGLVLVSSVGFSQTIITNPTVIDPSPKDPRGKLAQGIPGAVFSNVGDALNPPHWGMVLPVMQTTAFMAHYEIGFAASSTMLDDLADDISKLINAPGTPVAEALFIQVALRDVASGFASIGADMVDSHIKDSSGYHQASAGFAALSMSFTNLGFSTAASEAVLASTALSSVASNIDNLPSDPFDGWLAGLLDASDAQRGIANGLFEPLDAQLLTAPGAGPQANNCPPGSYRGCTNYLTTTYSYVSSTAWKRASGGISISYIVGSTLCPDGGVWMRTNTFLACTIRKCVCACYESRWDRFWASNGFNKTVKVSNLGCVNETDTEWEWECLGAPSSGAPSTPKEDIRLGSESDC